MGFKNWELLCNPTANFKTYWDSIQQVQHYAILHNHYSLKNTDLWDSWLGAVANENWLMIAIGFTFLMTGIAIAHCMVTRLIVSAAFVFPSDICYVNITPMHISELTKTLENSLCVTGWCKDFEITVACLKCLLGHRRTLPWDNHRTEQ